MSQKNAIQIFIPVLVLIALACTCVNSPALSTPPTPAIQSVPVQPTATQAPAPTLPLQPTAAPIPTVPPNSICGWIENTSTTGVMAPTLKLWDTGQVLELYMLESDATGKLKYSGPAWFRVYDPVTQDPNLLVNFSRVEQVANCP